MLVYEFAILHLFHCFRVYTFNLQKKKKVSCKTALGKLFRTFQKDTGIFLGEDSSTRAVTVSEDLSGGQTVQVEDSDPEDPDCVGPAARVCLCIHF